MVKGKSGRGGNKFRTPRGFSEAGLRVCGFLFFCYLCFLVLLFSHMAYSGGERKELGIPMDGDFFLPRKGKRTHTMACLGKRRSNRASEEDGKFWSESHNADDPGFRVSLTRLDNNGNYFGRTKIPGSKAYWLTLVFCTGGGLRAMDMVAVGRTRRRRWSTGPRNEDYGIPSSMEDEMKQNHQK
ncbi:uncharacterized protein F4807DRAFT_295414 [Annulohypoxylon truncatum]|uniref:uncharacterized protein n=1 Tax=Annulohypoxylon truncatum TaxID=327061 RepID=UPI0020080936|nr:uncharacterized protein F4807DRAFT_295414 [Annulohypoxylon truncatum]KAI1205082.1 hypothetical protein F4807DRAFT_295414 [Annulohypoxylon truncatum]